MNNLKPQTISIHIYIYIYICMYICVYISRLLYNNGSFAITFTMLLLTKKQTNKETFTMLILKYIYIDTHTHKALFVPRH